MGRGVPSIQESLHSGIKSIMPILTNNTCVIRSFNSVSGWSSSLVFKQKIKQR